MDQMIPTEIHFLKWTPEEETLSKGERSNVFQWWLTNSKFHVNVWRTNQIAYLLEQSCVEVKNVYQLINTTALKMPKGEERVLFVNAHIESLAKIAIWIHVGGWVVDPLVLIDKPLDEFIVERQLEGMLVGAKNMSLTGGDTAVADYLKQFLTNIKVLTTGTDSIAEAFYMSIIDLKGFAINLTDLSDHVHRINNGTLYNYYNHRDFIPDVSRIISNG